MDDAQPGNGTGLPPELDPRGGRHSARRRPAAAAPGSAQVVRRARPGRVRRVLSTIALTLSAALFAASGVGYLLYDHFDGNINRIPIGTVPGGPRPSEAPRGALNILLVGSDTRDFAGGEAFQGEGEKRVTNARSDTMMLAHLYGDTDKAQVISLPRDSRVVIPAHTDREGEPVEETKDKLNAAMELGGPALLIATVEKLTGVKIDHFVSVDFKGFQDMVEELDGVEVCLTEDVKEKDSGIDLKAGRQVVRGPQALAFVRQRQLLAGGDLGRIKRQQQFIGSMAREILDAKTLLNPVRLNGVLGVATRSLTIGDDLDRGKLRELALRLRTFDSDDVLFTTLPVADPNLRARNPDGLFSLYVQIDEEKAAQLFRAIRLDQPPGTAAAATTPKPSATPPLIVRPGGVRVEVFNGAGIAGLGRRAAQDLSEVGFRVVGTPSDRGAGVTRTIVRHGPDKADSARTLAAAIPGSFAEQDPALDRTLEVVVGSGYRGASQVTVRPQATKASPPPATERITTAAEDVCGA